MIMQHGCGSFHNYDFFHVLFEVDSPVFLIKKAERLKYCGLGVVSVLQV
jgi:hypothetical protein